MCTGSENLKKSVCRWKNFFFFFVRMYYKRGGEVRLRSEIY